MSYTVKTVYLTQNDYGDIIELQCLKDSVAYVLTNVSTLTFQMIGRQSNAKVSGTATVVDDTNGEVKYTWASGDLAVADIYDAEVEAVWTGTKEATFKGLIVVVEKELG